MLVSHARKFIYMKTVKTAGTSVELALQRYCMPDGYETRSHSPTPLVTSAGIVAARGATAKDFDLYHHMPAADVRNRLGPETWSSYTKFCNVRNPFDKVVSYFWMFMPPKVKERIEGQDFDATRKAFTGWLMNETGLPKDRDIYCIDDEPALDRYLRFETLDADLAAFLSEIGIDPAEIRVGAEKAQYRQFRERGFADYYVEKTASKVLDFYRRDFEHFGYAPDSWKAG